MFSKRSLNPYICSFKILISYHMEILIKASQFILSLSLLIVLHELGHFIPAKLFKTRVEKFYLFFDYKFSLFKKKIGDTVYGIGWIPLGGYVKISGMIDESMDTDQMALPPQPWEFRSKPAWQRLIIMLGGVFVNFVLGIFIYICLMWSYGEKFLPNDSVQDGVWIQGELATEIGLQNGDKILTIDGEKVDDISFYYFDMENFVLIAMQSEITSGEAKGMISEVTFSDYQEIGGLYFPFSMTQGVKDQPGVPISMSEIVLNPKVDDLEFKFPVKQ